jgi:hypothetical protein
MENGIKNKTIEMTNYINAISEDKPGSYLGMNRSQRVNLHRDFLLRCKFVGADPGHVKSVAGPEDHRREDGSPRQEA